MRASSRTRRPSSCTSREWTGPAGKDYKLTELGFRLNNFGVGKIVKSESSNFKEGDHIYGYMRMFPGACT